MSVSLKDWRTAPISGHGLVAEGAAHVEGIDGKSYRVKWNTVGGAGYGLCACGARSEILNSAYQRKQWHRGHKIALREAVAE